MRGRIRDVVANNPVLYFLAGFIVVGSVFLGLRRRYPVGTNDLLVEGFGFLLDIMLFGVFLSLYDKWRERRTKIRHYHDQLIDFLSWEGEEGVLRKVGIIRRLNEMQARLPDMTHIILPQAHLSGADLREVHLGDANLADADLEKANLRGADLRGAYLRRTALLAAKLEEANLEGADFRGAHLEQANLKRANLSGAYLVDANLEDADLEEADLDGASMRGAELVGANLVGAKGLTLAQLKEARLDEETKLPYYLRSENKNGELDKQDEE